ncbi:MAG: hypothetical protein ABWZ27_08145 [Aestuariivirgaceae bacterium]
MAKLTRSHSKSALTEGDVTFTAGTGRISIGITGRETGLRYDLHLSADEAPRFAAYVSARVEIDRFDTVR